VRKGAADRSYGVQVAQLAGLPKAVVDRARSVLDALEKGDREGASSPKAIIDDLPLFSAAAAAPPPPQPAKANAALDLLDDLHPDDLSPREALEALYKLKEAARS
jgi:DNA mismatch repair protein MutS